MERRIGEEQKRAASTSSMKLRSQPIDATTTPRQAPAQRRHHSFSSPATSHSASPAYSDHSTTGGFYSPRGGLDDDDDDDDDVEDGAEIKSDDDSELHEIEEREGDFSRPAPVLEPAPVTTTTVSRSVRVEPKMVTRVDSGAKEEKTRVVEGEEDGEVEVRSLSRRRSDERKRPNPKTAAFEMKEREEDRDSEVEFGEVRASVRRRSEERKRLNLNPKTAAFDSTNERDVEKEKEVVEDRRARRSEGRNTNNNTIVFDTAPLQHKEDQFVATRTVVFEPPVQKEEFVEAEDGGESGRGGVKQQQQQKSARRKQEGRRSEAVAMRKTALGLRVLGLAMCSISFSIMAADKNKGWALDSFDRYKEFRYCMAVSILGFVYSAAQACSVAYQLGSDKYNAQQSQFRYYLDFFLDQIISYLLISASSSAATRVEDWVLNWGRDKFPQMASASVIVSFLAFAVFAASSLVSGYSLCSLNLT